MDTFKSKKMIGTWYLYQFDYGRVKMFFYRIYISYTLYIVRIYYVLTFFNFTVILFLDQTL